MNNEHRGDVAFEVDGKAYAIRRSWNSICELEGLTGQGFYTLSMELAAWGPPLDAKGRPKKETEQEMRQRMGRIRGSTLRAVFCAMLREQVPDISLREVGDMMDELGTPKVLELVMLAFERGNPAETKGERPTQAAATDKPNGSADTAPRAATG